MKSSSFNYCHWYRIYFIFVVGPIEFIRQYLAMQWTSNKILYDIRKSYTTIYEALSARILC